MGIKLVLLTARKYYNNSQFQTMKYYMLGYDKKLV